MIWFILFIIIVTFVIIIIIMAIMMIIMNGAMSFVTVLEGQWMKLLGLQCLPEETLNEGKYLEIQYCYFETLPGFW